MDARVWTPASALQVPRVSALHAGTSTSLPRLCFTHPRRPVPPDLARVPLVSPLLFTRIATCVTPDLLLQHPDETLATYIRNS
jgi:hypothetical protein